MDVSVVIVNWNARDLLRGCLASIAKETRASHEVFVIDNASKDGSCDMVRAEFPWVKLMENETNRGFAAANNQGLREARGRYLLLLNPDTVILEGAIDKAIADADARVDAGVVGCQVWESPERIQRTCFSFPTPLNLFFSQTGLQKRFPRSRLLGRPELMWWDRMSERDVDVVSGMFMLVRREAMDQVGLMDEDYFVYGEEADWCCRFWRAGWRCVFVPTGRILHLEGGGKSTSQVRVPMYVQLLKSLLLFNRKNFGVLAWACAKGVFVLAMALKWATGVWTGGEEGHARRRLARASLAWLLTGKKPT